MVRFSSFFHNYVSLLEGHRPVECGPSASARVTQRRWSCTSSRPHRSDLGSSIHEINQQHVLNELYLPSGKRLHNYGKSPFSMGKSTISMAMFNSYVKLLVFSTTDWNVKIGGRNRGYHNWRLEVTKEFEPQSTWFQQHEKGIYDLSWRDPKIIQSMYQQKVQQGAGSIWLGARDYQRSKYGPKL